MSPAVVSATEAGSPGLHGAHMCDLFPVQRTVSGVRAAGLTTLVAFLLMVGLLAAEAGASPPASAAPGPDLVITPMAYDLGGLVPGQRTVRVFSLRNAGSEPLVIRLVRPSSPRLTTQLSATR